MDVEPLPGDSREQREAEALIIAELGRTLGVPLAKRRVSLTDGSWLELDGCSDSPPVVCEAWAHIGPPKSAQKMKVMTDALKLFVARESHFGGVTCAAVLAFRDDQAARHFTGRSWMAEALRRLEIDVRVVAIPPATREAVLRAQKRQFR